MKVIFLGTGGSVPTKMRDLPSVLIRRDADLLMFDCGEGTQRRFLLSRAGFNRRMRIFITHMHGDHVLGLPGMLHSMSFMGRTRELEIYGPKGIADFVEAVSRTVRFRSLFPVETREVRSGRVLSGEEYEVRAAWGDHGDPCLAFSLTEKPRPGRFNPARARRLGVPEGPLWKKLQKGRSVRVAGRWIDPSTIVGPARPGLKVTYAVDTRPCTRVVELARNSDLLIHDSTFAEDSRDKAREYGHSTAKEAAYVAKRSRSRRLALTHISAMYDDPTPLLREARRTFANSFLASDMMTVEVKELRKS